MIHNTIHSSLTKQQFIVTTQIKRMKLGSYYEIKAHEIQITKLNQEKE